MSRISSCRSLVLVLAPVLSGCTRTAAGDADAAKVPEVHADAEVVRSGNYTQVFTVTGTVTPAPGASAALSAPAASRVARVYVAEGDRVKVGDPLVAFDPTTLDADVSRAAAALSAARHARDRAQRLTEAGVAPRKELDQAMSALADAEAAMATARRSQSLAVLRAPIAGVVARVSVVRDESVDPTRSVVEVIDSRALEVVFGIPPRTAAFVMPGSLVQLESGIGADNQSLGSARVVAVGSTVDSASRNVTVRARPLDPSIVLRVGESVVGRISGASRAGVIAIPVEALIPEGETFHVFVVGADGIAHARKVRVLAQTDKLAHLGGGLTAGERIVTRGAFGVDEGVRIISASR
jgi:RND family efflux transporter MFP subunit